MQMIGTALLDGVEAAIKTSPWWIPNAPVLQIEGRREILGQYGTRWHGPTVEGDEHAPMVEPATHPGQTFSFTRRQCKAMRATLRAQAKRLTSPR
jgi:hypothetical protein